MVPLNNPINQIIPTGQPLVYFHTLEITEAVLERAVQAGRSLEIDVSIGRDGELFIGHPPEFYEFKRLPPPAQTLSIEAILERAAAANLLVVFDCKDVRALPRLQQVISDYGPQRSLFHSWLAELRFRPYPPEIILEPHWVHEDLPLGEVLALQQATGVPVIGAARGLTLQRLADEPAIIDTIVELAAGRLTAINFNLPDHAAPPLAVMQRLLDNGVLTLLNVDAVPAARRPAMYVGSSDSPQ